MTPREALTKAAQPQRIMQTEFGPYGNCQSACLASLLGVPITEVPNFTALSQNGDDNAVFAAQRAWLKGYGWGIVTIVRWQTLPWPPVVGYYIAGGVSPR